MSNLHIRNLYRNLDPEPPERGKSLLRKLALPLVLAVALVHGLLYMSVVPPWQGPDEHPHFTYVALLDKYNFDVEKVRNLDWSPGNSNEGLIQALSASMTRYNFNLYQVVHADPPPPIVPAVLGTSYRWQLRQPPAYYELCVVAMRGLRALGVPVDPYRDPAAALMVMRGVSLALSLVEVAFAWLAGMLLSRRGEYRLPLLLPLTVALFPMHTFSAVMANNDVLAEAAVAALFAALIALFRWPTGLRGTLLAACAALLAGAGALTKSTALAAAVPLLGLGLLVWLGLWLTRALLRLCPPSSERAVRVAVPLGLGLLGVIALLVLAATAFVPEAATAGWRLGFAPLAPAAQVATESAHDGSQVLELKSAQTGGAVQMLLPSVYHPELGITLSGWVRLAPAGTNTSPAEAAPSKATLSIENLRTSIAVGEAQLSSPGTWVPLVVSGTVPEGKGWVLFRLAADTQLGPVQFDDLNLKVQSMGTPWNNSTFSPTLLNPSFERGSLKPRDRLVRFLPLEIQQMLDVLANPQRFDQVAMWRGYAEPEYRSFWGNFGWLAVPLPDWLYILLGLLSLLALLGLFWVGLRKAGSWGLSEWLALVSLFGLGTAIFAGFAKQTMFLATEGGLAYPQGRYLFVLVPLIAWLLISGLSGAATLASTLWHRAFRQFGAAHDAASGTASALVWGGARKAAQSSPTGRASAGNAEPATWMFWTGITGLVLFSLYCLLVLVVPFYSR